MENDSTQASIIQNNNNNSKNTKQDSEIIHKQLQKCTFHNKKIKIYCIDNNCQKQPKIGCSKCLLKSQIHSQCEALELEEAVQQLKEGVEHLQKNIQNFRQKDTEEIDEMCKSIKMEFKNMCIQLQNQAQNMIDCVDSKKPSQKQEQHQQQQLESDDKCNDYLEQEFINILDNIYSVQNAENKDSFDFYKYLTENLSNQQNLDQQDTQKLNNSKKQQQFFQKIMQSDIQIESKVEDFWKNTIQSYIKFCQEEFKTCYDSIKKEGQKFEFQLKSNFQCKTHHQIINQHSKHINWVIRIDDQTIATCSDSIKFWDLKTFQCIEEIKFEIYHEVKSILQLNKQIFIAGLQNGSIRYYNCPKDMNKNNRNNNNNNVPNWDFQNENNNNIDDLNINSNNIQESNIEFNNMHSLKLNQIQHTDEITGLFKIDDFQFLSASFDSVIIQWNENGDVLAKYYDHTSLLYRHSISVFKNPEIILQQQFQQQNNHDINKGF